MVEFRFVHNLSCFQSSLLYWKGFLIAFRSAYIYKWKQETKCLLVILNQVEAVIWFFQIFLTFVPYTILHFRGTGSYSSSIHITVFGELSVIFDWSVKTWKSGPRILISFAALQVHTCIMYEVYLILSIISPCRQIPCCQLSVELPANPAEKNSALAEKSLALYWMEHL